MLYGTTQAGVPTSEGANCEYDSKDSRRRCLARRIRSDTLHITSLRVFGSFLGCDSRHTAHQAIKNRCASWRLQQDEILLSKSASIMCGVRGAQLEKT